MLFRKKDIDYSSLSPSERTWLRFRKNKTGMTGLGMITFAVIISVLGYLITPDQTAYANLQNPELHVLSPGTKVLQLQIRKNFLIPPGSWFSTMLYGHESPYTAIAISNYSFTGTDLLAETYTGNANETGEILRLNLADIVYPLQNGSLPGTDSLGYSITYQNGEDGRWYTEPVTTLREKIIMNQITEKKYLLGTDLLGRDLLSRLMIGTRISLTVGLISVFISILIGIVLGSVAGYFRGFTDSFISWLINVVWSIPTILLVIAITLVLGKGITQVFIAVGLTMWVDVARVVRGQVLSIREKEFVEAGKALGYGHARIIFRHILPNVMGPVIVMAASNFASAILMEAGLSFLGLGAQPPIPSWGEMINAHRGYILMDKAYLAFIPGVAIMLLVLAFMMVGNALRDAMDARLPDTPGV